uniref:Uncharacterized protein n=1 Tax=Utricularia reniformis TaxID=192314 RepID=A0A1Y0B030_9LAMI|nr:hypothetical protein AEK19_MT0540 [Utricularia reniformis]ART30796.1 hypothetical protein AEK19_MT0540 [Utricularia reniformis]
MIPESTRPLRKEDLVNRIRSTKYPLLLDLDSNGVLLT